MNGYVDAGTRREAETKRYSLLNYLYLTCTVNRNIVAGKRRRLGHMFGFKSLPYQEQPEVYHQET